MAAPVDKNNGLIAVRQPGRAILLVQDVMGGSRINGFLSLMFGWH
jgi:hypothetical protein